MPPRKLPKASPRPGQAAKSKRAPSKSKLNGALIPKPSEASPTATPPSRQHALSYHYPLLLNDSESCSALLKWFQGIEEARSMPWRKRWIDPARYESSGEELAEILARRGYEVWVSEIMLQQTRVSTVIPYFNTWIEKWPTIKDLAAASPDDVLSAWKGLGYYSRATRLHEGAKAMTSKPASPDTCPIPSTPAALMDVPGIGRYTAGAISSIAFGEAEAVLDGNVIRVLSRQMGIYADGKDKKITDVLWEAADLLVKSVARWPEVERSEVPGRWNQAVMELGSTVCTPRPKCDECPIQKTCRAYAEGTVLAQQKGAASGLVDIEDACTLCEQLDTEDLVTAPEAHGEEDGEEKVAKKRKIANASKPSNTISNYFAVKTRSRTDANEDKENGVKEDEINTAPANEPKKRKAPATQEIPKSVLTYCSLFPKKVPKKKPAEAASAVCIIELVQPDSPSKYLIEQRPAKGLLASLWQFPQNTLSDTMDTPESRKISAQKWLSDLGIADLSNAIHITELGTLVHIFSHLKLTMHVQHFRLEADKAKLYLKTESDLHDTQARRWVEATAMGDETLSTGMRRCWALVSSHE